MHFMRSQNQEARAFTIVELLVVIAIISALIGLLLPAVQAARESGRKTTCMNNLYQLGMGVNRFDQDAGRLPSWSNSFRIDPDTSVSGDEFDISVSWPVTVLPYIERIDLHERWSNNKLDVVQINSFTCPTAHPEKSTNAGPLAYAGNCGDGSNVSMATMNSKYNGVMPFPGVKYSLSDISDGDGTSKTLLFAEKCKTKWQAHWGLRNWTCKYLDPPDREKGVCSITVPFCFQQNLDPSWPAVQPCAANVASILQPPAFGISINLPDYGPSSQHSNGGVVAFCDGHTKFISGLDDAVYTQLVTSRNSKVTSSSYSAPPLNEDAY